MKTIDDLVKTVKRRYRLPSNGKLAKRLGVNPSLIFDWQAERRFPTPEQLLNLTQMAGENYGYWLIIIQARKAKTANLANRYLKAAAEISQ